MHSPSRPIARLLALCFALAWLLLSSTMPARAEAEPVITITQAEFATSASGPWQGVALPDTWALRGQPPRTVGHYRASFDLAQAPQGMWALRADRLSTHHELRVNGQLVHGTGDPPETLYRPMPTLVALPPGLLRAGRNTVEISAQHGTRAGLSTLIVGPERDVAAGFALGQLLATTLPMLLNFASAGVALFMLLLWWQRRRDAALGSFAALTLLAALRNSGYFLAGGPLNVPLTDWIFFVLQVATSALLGVFAMAFSGHRPKLYRGALAATAVLLPLAGAVAAWHGQLHVLRTWLYPWLIVLVVVPVALVLRAARERRSAVEYTLVAALLTVLAAGLHDYLFQQGRTSIMHAYWLPYAVPAVLVMFSAVLLQRLVGALNGIERMNTTLERHVAERTRELQAANSAKTRFLAAASHDLRQPMVSIGLLVGLLREQVRTPGLLGVVLRLQEATRAMEGLLKRLLDLSRLESGTVRVRPQALALQALFDAIASHHAEQAANKGLRLVLRPTRALVHSDPALLEQLLRNLVGNAVRYTESGGVLVAARGAGAGRLRIEVWDSGPGIPDEQRDTIFDEFVQLETTPPRSAQEVSAGLGLGLSIVKRCAALLDAPVRLRSRVGHGSCFDVLLPRSTEAPPAAAGAALPQGGLFAQRRVWLLEDDDGVRSSMALRLQRWGATVQAWSTLGALLRELDGAAAPPDLLVTDQRLPDGHGSAAVARLRERWPEAAALIVTGNTAPQDLVQLERWLSAGVPVLHKPFEADALLAAAQQALEAGVRA